MTVSVAFNGSNITTADSTTGWGVVKVTAGGGTPSPAAADGSIEGSGAVTTTSNQKLILLYFDTGTTYNFNSGGGNFGDLVYVWGNFLAAALLNNHNATNGGFGIFMSSGTPASNNYHLWSFYGGDNYAGGWKRMAVDPLSTPTSSAGTLNTGAIRYFGIFADTTNSPSTLRFDNMICDSIDVGTGLTVTGTSTLGLFDELVADEATNRYGIVQALNDSQNAFELNGKLILGDTTAATNSTISDLNSKIFASEQIYYNGTADTNAIPLTAIGVEAVGGTGTNSLTLGAAVGSTGGRSGVSLVGNATYDVGFDFSDGNVNTGNYYGCSFENLTGTLSFDQASHNFKGNTLSSCGAISFASGSTAQECSFVQSGAINLAGSAALTNCIVTESTAASAVVITDSTAGTNNITASTFTSDGSSHAVELNFQLSGATVGYNWTGNTANGYATANGSTGNEVLWVRSTTGTVNITVSGSTGTVSYRTDGATVNVVTGASITVNGLKAGSEVRFYVGTDPGTAVEAFTGVESSGTSETFNHTESGGTLGYYVIFAIGYRDIYVDYTYQSTDQTINVQQVVDRVYENPAP